MSKSRTTNIEKKICDAALKCIADKGWTALTYDALAKAAKVSTAEVRKTFPSIEDILPAIIHQTDIETAASVSKSLRGGVHDRLFEVLMARFDILQARRTAILNIIAEVKRNPALARHILPAEVRAMQKTLELADAQNDNTAKDILAVSGLLAVYAAVLCAWERDESADMSKTMAALDRHLRRAGKLADILFRAF